MDYGPVWDHCFIAEYPSVSAFVEMIRDPVYREAVKHRQAAVADSRLILDVQALPPSPPAEKTSARQDQAGLGQRDYGA
jgi:hypothetical protein